MELLNFIDGQFVKALGGKWLEKHEPATGKVYATVCRSDAADVDAAVKAAQRAFPSWSETSTDERFRWLMRIADVIEARLDAFAAAESQDQGKTVTTARTVDIPRSIENFRFYAQYITQMEGMALESKGAVHYTLRKPIGVVALISPWNLPLYLATWKIAPAIAFGNTCVIKPSELTPRTITMLAEVLKEVKLPAGVVNIVHGLGPECGQPLVEHPEVPAISFTGGTITGKKLAATAAPLLKKVSLELGGKNANIIFGDVEPAKMQECIQTTLRSSFANQGEICLCGSRILIQRSIWDIFVPAFVAAVKALHIGDPRDPKSFMGALISEAHTRKVESYIKLAQEEGGVVLAGGSRPAGLPDRCRDGYFVAPTVISNVAPKARVNQEEIFGPVVTLIPFETEEEAVAIANGTQYGLAASVWTGSVSRANRVSAALDVGYVWINCWLLRDLRMPFGGVKASGIGREGGKFAMDFYTEVKSVCSKL